MYLFFKQLISNAECIYCILETLLLLLCLKVAFYSSNTQEIQENMEQGLVINPLNA